MTNGRNILLNQLLSIAGAILILIAYAALQMKRLPPESVSFQVMNLFGGLFLFIAAVILRQYGFILVEGMWTLLSAAGLWRVTRRS
jgi:uncharacterized membrane protein